MVQLLKHCKSITSTDLQALFPAVAPECLFGLGKGLHNPEYMLQYWGALASFLTKLKMFLPQNITSETYHH